MRYEEALLRVNRLTEELAAAEAEISNLNCKVREITEQRDALIERFKVGAYVELFHEKLSTVIQVSIRLQLEALYQTPNVNALQATIAENIGENIKRELIEKIDLRREETSH